MSESIASWITLSALVASIGWYVYQNNARDLQNFIMSAASGLLCLCGGFLISGAIMKVTGSLDSAIFPALLVCLGTAGCVTAHTLYKKKQTQKEKPSS
ncbi:MAG: hypothetical protein ACPF9K_13715 [Neptuniibacter sp.]